MNNEDLKSAIFEIKCDLTHKTSFSALDCIEDYITNLQEENKKLNYILNNKFANICIKEMIGKLSAVDLIVLQQERIDKAIEYINNLSNEPNIFGHYGIEGNCKKYLLNILQGSDKDD